jgi:hypothetical protein
MDVLDPTWDAFDPVTYDDYDALLSLMYIEYLYCVIYIERISYIQACWRRYRARKAYRRALHKAKFVASLYDVVEVAYSPPNPRYPLIASGGSRYREGYESFMRLANLT